jgi:hypothetical protein
MSVDAVGVAEWPAGESHERREKRMKGVERFGWLVVLVGCALGCGLTEIQREAVTHFGNSATSLGGFAAGELPQLRDTAIAMNKADIAIGGSRKIGDLERNVEADDVVRRVKAAEALRNYGTLLTSLATDTEADALKKASDDFVNSVKSVSEKKLSDAQLEALGEIVRQIGSWVVEHKKANAIKAIVPTVQPDIDALCGLLADDLNPTGGHLAQEVDATIIRVESDVDDALGGRATFAERGVAIDAAGRAMEARARLAQVDAPAVAAFGTLKKGNDELVGTLQENALTLKDIEEVAQEAEAVTTAAKALAGK